MYKSNIQIVEAKKTGGKAGKGFNKTSTIQVIETVGNMGYSLLKQFRFLVADKTSKQKAMDKASQYVKGLFPNESNEQK